MNYYTKTTKLGDITIVEDRGFVTALIFGSIDDGIKNKSLKFSKFLKNRLSETIELSFNQLEEYFNGTRKEFSLPLNPTGTPFQQKVWSALLSIPYGQTRSYKDIAIQLGDSNAVRAVGMANNKNKIPIFIPCHRVVFSDGSLGGYGAGELIKKELLDLECNN